MIRRGARRAFVGGSVWTSGYSRPRPLDVLVVGSRIAGVSARGELDTTGADVHDMTGRLVVPGFQDAHLHLATGGFDQLTCDLAGATSADEVYRRIASYATSHPDLPWVVGGGWDRELFPYPGGPSKERLDLLVPDRPAVMTPYDRHGMWVNSAALHAAGVGPDTPDPEDGSFRRHPSGELTGMVEEGAMATLRAAMPPTTSDRVASAILRAQDHLVRLGITSVQDALVGTGLGMLDQHEALIHLLGTEDLRLRVTAALWWDPARGLEQIPDIVSRRDALHAAGSPERINADMVKVMIDGAGLLFLDAAQIRDATIALDALGLSVHFHSYGDAATAWALDAVEAAIASNTPWERRHHIAHLFVVGESEFARFGELGVAANMQGFWLGSGVPHDHLHPSTRTDHPQDLEYPFGRLVAAGAPLAAGSDWPVTSADPLLAIRTANGDYVDPGGRSALTELDHVDAVTTLEAFTVGSARVNGRPASTGRIAQGYLADLAIIEGDVTAWPKPEAFGQVVETWIGGVRVFQRDA